MVLRSGQATQLAATRQGGLGGRVKRCFAGTATFGIDASGSMFLCQRLSWPNYPVLELGFQQSWEALRQLRKVHIEKETRCGGCRYRVICGVCAPRLRYSPEGVPDPDRCELGMKLHEGLLSDKTQ